MGEYADMSWDAEDPESWTSAYIPDYRGARRRRMKTCRVCGANALRWDLEDNSYYLSERDGSRHVCKFKGFMR